MTISFTGLENQKDRLRAVIDRNVSRVIDHGRFIMGPEVGQLEECLKSYCGARHAIAVANGTDALQIALMAKGIGHGDAVLVPSFTYTATAEVILVLGATPIFLEVRAETFNLDPSQIDKAVTVCKSRGLNPRALIAVDLFGLPAEWDDINAAASRNGIFVIADAAQSFGAKTQNGQFVGTLAPVTTTSFFPAKPLGCYGDGGAIFTDDDDLANVMRSIRVHGQGTQKYDTVRVGLNSRLDTIQAAVLLAKLDVFSEEISHRNALADFYNKRLSGSVNTPVKPAGTVSAWAQYTIRVANRDALQAALTAAGVPTAVYYPRPMHLQTAYRSYGGGEGSLPVSEKLSAEVLSLPMNPYMAQADAEAVCDAVLKSGS